MKTVYYVSSKAGRFIEGEEADQSKVDEEEGFLRTSRIQIHPRLRCVLGLFP